MHQQWKKEIMTCCIRTRKGQSRPTKNRRKHHTLTNRKSILYYNYDSSGLVQTGLYAERDFSKNVSSHVYWARWRSIRQTWMFSWVPTCTIYHVALYRYNTETVSGRQYPHTSRRTFMLAEWVANGMFSRLQRKKHVLSSIGPTWTHPHFRMTILVC